MGSSHLVTVLLVFAPASHGLEMPRTLLRANPLPPTYEARQTTENSQHALAQKLEATITETMARQAISGLDADDDTIANIADMATVLGNLQLPASHVLAGSLTPEMNESMQINMTLPAAIRPFGLETQVPNMEDLERLVGDTTNHTKEWYFELFQMFIPDAANNNYRIPAPTPTAADYESRDWAKFVDRPDGRKVEYRVSGDTDGTPVFYTHGFLMCAAPFPAMDEVAKKLGIKLISATLPSWGLSTPYPLGTKRSLADWPDDVKAILDQEGVTKAHLFGISFGGPHTMALALGLPNDMVGNVAFVVPVVQVPNSKKAVQPTWPEPNVPENHFHRIMRNIMGIPYFGDKIGHDIEYGPLMELFPDNLVYKARHPDGYADMLDTMESARNFTYRGIPDNGAVVDTPFNFLMGDLENLVQDDRAVAIVSAADDTICPPNTQQILHQVITGSTMIAIKPGIGGHLAANDPGVMEQYMQFLLSAASGMGISTAALLLAGLLQLVAAGQW